MIPLAFLAPAATAIAKGAGALWPVIRLLAPLLIVYALGIWSGSIWQSGREANARAALSVQITDAATALAACRGADADAARAQAAQMIKTVEANTALMRDANASTAALAATLSDLERTPRETPVRLECLTDADDVRRFERLRDAAAGSGGAVRNPPGRD